MFDLWLDNFHFSLKKYENTFQILGQRRVPVLVFIISHIISKNLTAII